MPVGAFGRLRFSLSFLAAVLLIALSRWKALRVYNSSRADRHSSFVLTVPAAHKCRKSPRSGIELGSARNCIKPSFGCQYADRYFGFHREIRRRGRAGSDELSETAPERPRRHHRAEFRRPHRHRPQQPTHGLGLTRQSTKKRLGLSAARRKQEKILSVTVFCG